MSATDAGLDVDAIRDSIDIVAFIGNEVALRSASSGAHKGLCPLHSERTASFHVYERNQRFYCYGCNRGGDVIEYVRETRGVGFVEALEILGGRTAIAAAPKPRLRLVDPPEHPEVQPFLAALWAIVERAPWSPAAAKWLAEARGVEPDAARALGCRDWSTRRDELKALFERTPVEVLKGAGLHSGRAFHVAVAGIMRADRAWTSIAVPVWRIGRSHPERWRYRYLSPPAGRQKTDSPFSGAVPIDLLGLGRPARLPAPEARLAWIGSGAPGSRLVLVVEGEPDWWSATEVVDGRAVVIAVTGSSTCWKPRWPALADLQALGVQRIAVCVHHGARELRGGRELGHGEALAEDIGLECERLGLAFTRKLPAEGRDLNDLHRAGLLSEWLADVLEVPHGR